jgi:hypothetical protein
MPLQLFSDVSKQGSIRLSIRDMPELEPKDGEVVVKVGTVFVLALPLPFVFVLSCHVMMVLSLSCLVLFLNLVLR